jgi:hypothetical protein
LLAKRSFLKPETFRQVIAGETVRSIGQSISRRSISILPGKPNRFIGPAFEAVAILHGDPRISRSPKIILRNSGGDVIHHQHLQTRSTPQTSS